MPQPSFSDNHLEFPGKQAGYRARVQSPRKAPLGPA
jgi:hypothetical protein